MFKPEHLYTIRKARLLDCMTGWLTDVDANKGGKGKAAGYSGCSSCRKTFYDQTLGW